MTSSDICLVNTLTKLLVKHYTPECIRPRPYSSFVPPTFFKARQFMQAMESGEAQREMICNHEDVVAYAQEEIGQMDDEDWAFLNKIREDGEIALSLSTLGYLSILRNKIATRMRRDRTDIEEFWIRVLVFICPSVHDRGDCQRDPTSSSNVRHKLFSFDSIERDLQLEQSTQPKSWSSVVRTVGGVVDGGVMDDQEWPALGS